MTLNIRYSCISLESEEAQLFHEIPEIAVFLEVKCQSTVGLISYMPLVKSRKLKLVHGGPFENSQWEGCSWAGPALGLAWAILSGSNSG